MTEISALSTITPAGTELLPCDLSGAARAFTVSSLLTYVLDQIEAISAGSVIDGAADGIYILDATDGVFKPVTVNTVVQQALDNMWGKAAEATPDGADVMPLLDGSTEKTVTLTVLAEFVRSTIESSILDVSDLADGSGTLATTDYMLVTQGSTAKQITVQDLYDAIYNGLAAHVTGKSSAGALAGTDEAYVVRGGTAYKTDLDAIATYAAAAATLSGSGTSGLLASWSGTSTLTGIYSVTTSGTGFAAGSDTAIPTTAAVRKELDEIVNDDDDIGDALADADTFLVYDATATAQKSSALSRIWTWINAKTDLALSVIDIDGGTDIGAALADADLLIVDDGATGTNRKSAMSRVWTYIDTKIKAMVDLPISAVDLDGGTDIGAALDDADLILVDDGAGGTNRKSALSRVWTWVNAKTDLAISTVDLDGGTDIGADLADADLILVDDGAGGTNRKSAMSRVWTYVKSKVTGEPVVLATYTVAGVPAASSYTGGIIYCSNGAAGNPVLAFSNGTNWLRCDTLGAVSAT